MYPKYTWDKEEQEVQEWSRVELHKRASGNGCIVAAF